MNSIVIYIFDDRRNGLLYPCFLINYYYYGWDFGTLTLYFPKRRSFYNMYVSNVFESQLVFQNLFCIF